MGELGWADDREVERARKAALDLDPEEPRRGMGMHFLDWVAAQVEARFEERAERGRGFVVETTLDPLLQAYAEDAVRRQLVEIRRSRSDLRGRKPRAALVALDAGTGEVLAYVGGDPADRSDRFDRARKARRQPGSTVKPLLLLEAFQACGEQRTLNPSTRVVDEPLRIDLPSGPWEPGNPGNRYRGVVDLREALRLSLNVPFVRVSRWCGEEATAGRMRRAGLSLPDDPPPSYALGAIETTPLELAGAYTVFASRGRAARPFGVRRIEKPSGNRIARLKPQRTFVVHSATAFLIHDLMRDAVETGTGARAAIEGLNVAGKTGSTRDAWFVGDASGIVTVAWVGLDEGDLGLSGGRAAAPLWRRFMARAVEARARREVERPRDVVTRRVDPESGLLLSGRSRKGREEIFNRRALPRKDRWLRPDRPEPVVR
jgi:membrane peptidoglycan carboxypeptidase